MAEPEAVLQEDGAKPESEVEQAVPEVEAGRTEDQPDPDAPGTEETLGEEELEEGEKKREGGYKRKLRRAQSEADYWRQKAQERPAEAKPPAEDPAPRFEEYEDKPLDQYLSARETWLRRQVVRETLETVEKQQRTKSEQSEHDRAQQQFFQREEAAADAYEDYEDVSTAASQAISDSDTPTAANLGHALIASEKGPELLYHLGKNPVETQRLLQLPPVLALIELGKLEARIAQDKDAEPGKPPPRITQATPPHMPLRKTSAAAQHFDPLNPSSYRDFAGYEKAMNERERKGRT